MNGASKKAQRQHSFEKEPNDEIEAVNLRLLKSIDENDFEQFERSDLVGHEMRIVSTLAHRKDGIKLAAIYNNQEDILKILQSEKDMDSIQKLLSEQDDRGHPCIFYAVESRSRDALQLLMSQVKKTDCIVAANGESVLHVATRMGDVNILRCLMELDLAVALVDHVENRNGRTPLHLAAQFNHVDIARELLIHGAKFDRKDVTGRTPIFMAASKGHSAMLEIFLDHGQGDIENLILDHNNCLYGTAYRNLLQVAVDSGDEKTVDICFSRNSEIARKCLSQEIKNPYSWLLHTACGNGMENYVVKVIQSMRTLEALHLNRKDVHGLTPIHRAALNNHANIVKMIGSISRPFVNQTTPYQQTTLMLAVQEGHIKVVEELINLKASFQIRDSGGKSVLHHAIRYPRILEMLLKKDDVARFLINGKEKDGYTPAHNAALKGSCKCFKLLVEKGADINVFTATGRSTLHCAVSSQSVDMVCLVLSNEPALINKADSTGKTPLHTAASYGNVEIVKVLVDNGALIVRDNNIYSPLHNAAHKGHLDVVEKLLSVNSKIMDWKNKYGRTALIEAATTGKMNVVEFLLERGASVEEDHEFLNCLDWCLINNDRETAMLMMRHSRWAMILQKTKHRTEGTMAKLVYKMPDVAYQVLTNSVTSQGHPDSKEHVKRYDFRCLQSSPMSATQRIEKLKPMTAVKTMIRTKCYDCLTHPVCCKFLKMKWMQFGWKVHSCAFLMYLMFLICLNVYAFGIPAYKTNKEQPAPVNVQVAMVFCLLFTSLNFLKELYQLIFYRARYFLDVVNYLECVMYILVFIFAVPVDGNASVKTSLQWKACCVSLLLAWINVVLFLRRFASYGIIVLMMKTICVTLVKVLSLLIFFFVAFAAAFTPIMNDKPGFGNFGLAMLTSAVMTTGEIDFREAFLEKGNEDYETFYLMRLTLLVVFLVFMPIILMNLLLALAIDDTSKIRQQAALMKHIQMAEMIINLERRRTVFLFPITQANMLPPYAEKPNKTPHFLRTMWVQLFYGSDYSCDNESKNITEAIEGKHDDLTSLVNTVKDMHEEVKALRHELRELQKVTASPRKRGSRKDFRSASTQFHGFSSSFDSRSLEADSRRTKWHQSHDKFAQTLSEGGADEDVFSPGQDVDDEKARETKECDPEFIELKKLYDDQIPAEDYENTESETDGRVEEVTLKSKLIQEKPKDEAKEKLV